MRISNTSERLRAIIKERNIAQVDILQAAKPYCIQYGVKLGKSDLSQYVNGKVEPKQEKLTILGLALGVNEAWLMGYDVPMERAVSSHPQAPNHPQFLPMPKMKKWRVIGATACGQPTHRELEEFVFAPDNINADLVFRCEGDSMIGAHILDGDIAFVRTCEVEDGQIAVVRIEDDYSLKRIYRGPDYLELRSENPKYPPIIIRGEQTNAEIIGRVIFFLTRPL